MDQRNPYTDRNDIISTGFRVGIRAASISIKLGLTKQEPMHSPRDVRDTGEAVGVDVEYDRCRSATENALVARILVRG